MQFLGYVVEICSVLGLKYETADHNIVDQEKLLHIVNEFCRDLDAMAGNMKEIGSIIESFDRSRFTLDEAVRIGNAIRAAVKNHVQTVNKVVMKRIYQICDDFRDIKLFQECGIKINDVHKRMT